MSDIKALSTSIISKHHTEETALNACVYIIIHFCHLLFFKNKRRGFTKRQIVFPVVLVECFFQDILMFQALCFVALTFFLENEI